MEDKLLSGYKVIHKSSNFHKFLLGLITVRQNVYTLEPNNSKAFDPSIKYFKNIVIRIPFKCILINYPLEELLVNDIVFYDELKGIKDLIKNKFNKLLKIFK